MSSKRRRKQKTEPRHKTGGSRPLSLRKCIAFSTAVLIVSVLLLELLLRAFSVGGVPSLFKPVLKIADSTIYQTSNDALWLFFGSRFKGGGRTVGSMVPERVEMPKPPGVVRVFMVGESTVQGFPYPPNLCASAFLQRYLQQRIEGKRVEVVNLGITAVASFPLRYVVDQALTMQPDLIVIYAGHNEYFGAFGVASTQGVGSSPWQMRMMLALRSTGIYQGVERLFGLFSNVSRETENAERLGLMSRMAGQELISPSDPIRRRAENSLKANLDYCCMRARQKNVPVVLCSLASNLADLEPIRNSPSKQAPGDWDKNLQLATEKITSEPAAARSNLEKLSQQNPDSALVHFLLGQTFAAERMTTEAGRQYVIARDLDAMPWRATSAMNETIQKCASGKGVVFCDVATAFTADAGGAPGWKYFTDHLHPSIEGQALLAWEISKTIGEARVLSLADKPKTNPSDDAILLGYNPLVRFNAARKVLLLFQSPPLDSETAARGFRSSELASITKDFQPYEGAAAKESEEEIRAGKTPASISYLGGRQAMAQSKFMEAASYFRAAQFETPQFSPQRSAAAYYMRLSLVRAGKIPRKPNPDNNGDLMEALYTEKALSTGRDLLIHAVAGLSMLQGDESAATSWAAKMNPSSQDAKEFREERNAVEAMVNVPR